MNKNYKQFLIITCFLSFFTLSKSIVHAQGDSNNNTPLYENVFSRIFESSKSCLADVFARAKKLNYFTSKGLVIPVKALNQDIIFNWQEAGSGDLFTPFKSIESEIKVYQNNYDSYADFKNMGVAIAQDELVRLLSQGDVLDNIKQALSPFGIFSLKVMLLIKTITEHPDYKERFVSELLRLLIKLSITEDIPFDKVTQLFENITLPESLTHVVNAQIPGGFQFFKDIWTQIHVPGKELSPCLLGSVSCFVFKDERFASLVYKHIEKIEHLDYESWNRYITGLIDLNKHKVIPFELFEKENKSGFVGQFTTTTLSNALPAPLFTHIKNQSNASRRALVQLDNGLHAIYRIHNDLSIPDSLKVLVSVLFRTVKKYIQIRQDLLTGKNKVLRKSQDAYKSLIKERLLINSFTELSCGRNLNQLMNKDLSNLDQQCAELYDAHNKGAEVLYQALNMYIEMLDEHVDSVNKSINQHKKELYAKTSYVPFIAPLWNIFPRECVAQEKEALEQKISLLQNQKKQLENQRDLLIDQLDNYEKLQKYEKQHEYLQVQKEKCKDVSGEVFQGLEERIDTLEQKIEAIKTENTFLIVSLQKEFYYHRLASIYTSYAQKIETQCKQRKAKIDRIYNKDKRMAKELAFERKKQILQSMKKQLIKKNEKIKSDLEKLQKFIALKNAQLCNDSFSESEELRDLENSIGYMLSSTVINKMVSNTFNALPELAYMVEDFSNNEIKPFKNIKKEFQMTLANVVYRIPIIKNNRYTFDYFIKAFLPDLFFLIENK